ncbi:MAG: hypothetical protein IPO32_07350 [Crocinitomicaceae bacterium]|jgi:hypothetical protein|nr:hypothetical protein [Crocinitomicaceae bacterium]MBK6952075.1 hypothetical protein [Crocinitomicaceae bacterium]MBK9591312.1 hypothetical protein [Crocinitomicaceae bacterium]
MKNRKMNLDRPPLDQKEIQMGMNFGQLMVSYQAMSKPFYKTKWFFGTAGMASIGLIVGGTFAFQSSDKTMDSQANLTITDSPPISLAEHSEKQELFALNYTESPVFEETKQTEFTSTKEAKHDKKNTPLSIPEPLLISSQEQVNTDLNSKDESAEVKNTSEPIDLTPRINGRANGDITREDLLDNKGLTTNADVSIIHFELHLIDGLGGKVFEEESNQLNKEMKEALKNVNQGEMIYFENIKGKTAEGHVVRLNPLRYVLLN